MVSGHRPNVLAEFYPRNTHTYALNDKLGDAMRDGRVPTISAREMANVKKETHDLGVFASRLANGIATEYAGQRLWPTEDLRLIMVNYGTLHNNDPERTRKDVAIPFDFGHDHHLLFKQTPRGESVDDYLTDLVTYQTLTPHKKALLEEGFHRFDVTSSRYFLVPKSSLEEKDFLKGEYLDARELMPYISSVKGGYIDSLQVDAPSYAQFLDRSVPNFSWRIKGASLPEKMMKKWSQKEYDHPITDYLGFGVVGDRSLKQRVYDDFASNGNSKLVDLGAYKLQGERIKDISRGNGFSQRKMIAYAYNGKSTPMNTSLLPTEWRGWTPDALYDHAIDPISITRHEESDRHRVHLPSDKRKLLQNIEDKLFGLFAKPVKINIADLPDQN